MVTKTQERILEAKKTPPLRTLSDSDLNELVDTIALMVGVSDYTRPERVALSGFMQQNYPTMGKHEALLAFDFAFAGKYILPDLRVKSISARFVGMILTAYETFKRVEMKGVDEGFLMLAPMTESEIGRKNREAIRFFFERHKENVLNKTNPDYKKKYFPGSVCYDWLKSQGINLPEPEVKEMKISDRRLALEIQADATAVSKLEIVKVYFDSLIQREKAA